MSLFDLNFVGGNTRPHPGALPRGENRPKDSRIESQNRHGTEAPSPGSAGCQPARQRAERVLGAPVLLGRRAGMRTEVLTN